MVESFSQYWFFQCRNMLYLSICLCHLWFLSSESCHLLRTGFCFLAAAKSLQSCPTLCDPIDGSPPGSAVPGILQARTLEWVAISFSNAWKWKLKVKSLSHVLLFATAWTAAHQAPPSMGFSRQEYWSGVPLPFASSLIPTLVLHGRSCPLPAGTLHWLPVVFDFLSRGLSAPHRICVLRSPLYFPVPPHPLFQPC